MIVVSNVLVDRRGCLELSELVRGIGHSRAHGPDVHSLAVRRVACVNERASRVGHVPVAVFGKHLRHGLDAVPHV